MLVPAKQMTCYRNRWHLHNITQNRNADFHFSKAKARIFPNKKGVYLTTTMKTSFFTTTVRKCMSKNYWSKKVVCQLDSIFLTIIKCLIFEMHHTQIVFNTQKNLFMIFTDFSSNFVFQVNVLLKLHKSKSAKSRCPFVWQKASRAMGLISICNHKMRNYCG